MQKIIVICLFVFLFFNTQGQDFVSYLKDNAIQIDKPDSLSKEVYDILSENKLIMIGEMHGTNEPAKFVEGLAELFTRFNDSVQVGFEIPPEQMELFLKLSTDSSVFNSDFFYKNQTNDGRSSLAWANAIMKINKTNKATVFFYDMNGEYSNDRDSLMYLNIKTKISEHPTWKTITLSGNIHNMLTPYKEQKKVANYLYNDVDLKIADKICSIDHSYQVGTMLNNIGNGLELREVEKKESVFAEINSDRYLCIYPKDIDYPYTGVYYTKFITAAKLTRNN